jgi:hypothetical protein
MKKQEKSPETRAQAMPLPVGGGGRFRRGIANVFFMMEPCLPGVFHFVNYELILTKSNIPCIHAIPALGLPHGRAGLGRGLGSGVQTTVFKFEALAPVGAVCKFLLFKMPIRKQKC